MSTALSKRSRRLAELTDTIQRGLATFVEVGRALLEVRQERLWSDGWESFDAWCQDVHGFGQTYASRLITASKTAEDLPDGQKPANERQARKVLQEQKQAEKHHPTVADDADDDQGASGGAEPVISGTLSGTEPDPAGVDSSPVELDRVRWSKEWFAELWDRYRHKFGDQAEWLYFSLAWEEFATERGDQ